MVKLRTRLIQVGFILCLLTVLSSGISLDPQLAAARPLGIGGPSGDPYGMGDPTGDDLPSPTPKPTIRAAKAGAAVTTMQTGRTRAIGHWTIYSRILIRLGIR